MTSTYLVLETLINKSALQIVIERTLTSERVISLLQESKKYNNCYLKIDGNLPLEPTKFLG